MFSGNKLLISFLDKLVHTGHLIIVFADGSEHHFGDRSAPAVTLRLHDEKLARRLFLNPDMALGEAYMDGSLSVDKDDLYGLLELLIRNLATGQPGLHYRIVNRLRIFKRWIDQYNPVTRSHRNVAHHYDLSDKLYDLFLDRDRQYSCAYYTHPEASLEEAQQAKKDMIARKLLLKPGMKVLDIGCGWGGMAQHIAENYEADVQGITLSRDQLAYAQKRRAKKGSISYSLTDYRHVSGKFDRIVSVGMFEHVGVPHFREYFDKVKSLLNDDGVALLHTIGRADGPGATNPWIQKYIFPGGYVPALSEILPAIEQAGLVITDIEVWRLHYAETLRAWRRRFLANRHVVDAEWGEEFRRMWLFYLISSEITFRYNGHVVFQIQLAKSQDAVPLTRDYLYRDDKAPSTTAERDTTENRA